MTAFMRRAEAIFMKSEFSIIMSGSGGLSGSEIDAPRRLTYDPEWKLSGNAGAVKHAC